MKSLLLVEAHRWRLDCQPYVKAALYPKMIPGTQFCSRVRRTRAIVRLEGLGKLKKLKDLIGTRTRDLPTCSIVPQPSTLPQLWQYKNFVTPA
jgi:hypothetical protein